MNELKLKADKKKVHFLHIGKTGGSAIKSVLNKFTETTEYSLQLHTHGTSLKNIPEGESVVFFLRHPVSRFTSAFYSRQRKGAPRYFSEWSSEEIAIFNQFATPNELALSLASKQSSAIAAMNSVHHFTRYSYWYHDFDYFKARSNDILFVGFQETLNTDFAKLKNILGIPEEADLPTDNIAAHRNPDHLDRSIDQLGKSALLEWYADDIRFASLCREIMLNRESSC